MSTKPIREALENYNRRLMMSPLPSEPFRKAESDAYAAAIEAVRAIEEMARVLLRKDVTGAMDDARSLLESIAKEAP